MTEHGEHHFQKHLSPSTRAGEHASLKFHIACLQRGLLLARPVIDCWYDMIVHNSGTNQMWRVQVKRAGRIRSGYWVGSTHRRRGTRYPSGFIQRFVFEKPDGSGFWIIEGKRLDGRTGCGLKDKDWEKWELFDVES